MEKQLEDRITNLEIKYVHQDDFLEKLNEIVILQQSTIGRLEKEIMDLKRNATAVSGVEASRTLADDKPPHY